MKLPRIPLISSLSFVLLVTLIVLWCRSGRQSVVVRVCDWSGRWHGFASDRGGLLLVTSDMKAPPEDACTADGGALDASEFQSLRDVFLNSTVEKWKFAGFHFAKDAKTTWGCAFKALLVPYWALLLPLAILPTRSVRRALIWLHRKRRGRCLGCGYDLRQSPERCPECGLLVKAAAEPVRRAVAVRAVGAWVLAVVTVGAGGELFWRGRAARAYAWPSPASASFTGDDLRPVARTYRVGDVLDEYSLTDWLAVPRGSNTFFQAAPGAGKAPGAASAPPDMRALERDGISRFVSLQLEVTAGALAEKAEPTVAIFGNYLVACETPAGHCEVQSFLSLLRCGDTSSQQAAGGERPPDPHANVEQKISELKFDSVTLEQAIDRIRETTESNIIVNWDDLSAAGIERRAPVKLHLWNVTLDQALRAIFAVVGSNGNISYEVRENIIEVMTTDRLHGSDANRPTRLYDVRDLVDQILDYHRSHDAPIADSQPANTMGHPVISGLTADEAVDLLARLIEDQVDTDSWRDNGGTDGALHGIAGRLIITQTPENHRKLVALLRTLRAGGTKEGTDLFGRSR